MVEFRILRERSKIKKQDHNPGLQESNFCLFSDMLGKVPRDTALERSPQKLADFQRCPSPSSRTVHPDKYEIKQRWQEACMENKELLTQA